MSSEKRCFVYILVSRSRNLYTGLTNNLLRRVLKHKQKSVKGFTAKYRVHRLVYFESFQNVRDAIRCEKKIKSWRREKKVALIQASNPTWEDLAASWFPTPASEKADSSPAYRRQALLGMTTCVFGCSWFFHFKRNF